jgi:GT2 family glycosyltransferase
MYGEDVDLCLRARRTGWRPVITPDASVIHHVGASSSNWTNKCVLLLTGKATLANSHWAGWRRQLCLTMLDLGIALRALGDWITRTFRPNRTRTSDWPEVLRRRPEWRSGYLASLNDQQDSATPSKDGVRTFQSDALPKRRT